MSITPKGMSLQEAYRLYRDDRFVVNRRYQRKLVWTVEEKQRLIDSIRSEFPIPLILLAERVSGGGLASFEIIDGMQRLNAIFTFIEMAFDLGGHYFDIREFPRANQAAKDGKFTPRDGVDLLTPDDCADFLDYNLAVTTFPAKSDDQVNSVFGRINSNGKHLSPQETRQAGVSTAFADLVRRTSAEIRGDTSADVLLLAQMPQISIETEREQQGYGVRADDTFWCRQGILLRAQLRDSEDEQLLADIAASILLEEPFAFSREQLDQAYSLGSKLQLDLENRLSKYGSDRLSHEIKTVLSVLRDTLEAYSADANCLRNAVRTSSSGNPIKTEFYAVFMTFFDFMVTHGRSPDDPTELVGSLRGLAGKLDHQSHYTTTEGRQQNIRITRGLLDDFFVKKTPPALLHGPGLALDFENSIRRSRIESSRYECKQGLCTLAPTGRIADQELMSRLSNTICAIANVGPEADGFLFVGVADKKADADRVLALDGVAAIPIGDRFVVGVDREAKLLGIQLERHVEQFSNAIRNSALTDPLKTQVLSAIDCVEYKGLSVIRVRVPAQRAISFVGDVAYVRDGANTKEARGPALAAVVERFLGHVPGVRGAGSPQPVMRSFPQDRKPAAPAPKTKVAAKGVPASPKPATGKKRK
ncbi:MAG: DUF262 domain-containing protein [Archangium sp.]|nr:DUF262 domain-containing protein [Archangium sp.]MDP3571241.1 DUF262 domain-containing protein [Archangium sp.]